MSTLTLPAGVFSPLRFPRITAMPIEVGACLILQAENYLSAREINQLRQFKNSRRQQEWFTARLALKLLLTNYKSGFPTSVPPILKIFQLEDIRKIPLPIYRHFEILTDATPNQKRPQLFWQGTLLSNLHLSISHAGGWAVVAVSSWAAIGIECGRVSCPPSDFLCTIFFHQGKKVGRTTSHR